MYAAMVLLGLLLPLLAGCPTMSMSPEQLKASAGMTTCGTSQNMYGKVSVITTAVDDTRKGATSSNSTVITCGDASMKIDNSVGVAQPAPSGSVTTTTTTTAKPVQ